MFAELDVKTNFSFLRGASHADELVCEAASAGLGAIGITDLNTLSGVVRAHQAAKEAGIRLCVGAQLRFFDAPDVLVWVENRDGYANLCRLLTHGKRRAEKGQCLLYLEDLLNGGGGLEAALSPMSIDPEIGEVDFAEVERVAGKLREAFGDRLSLGVSRLYEARDRRAVEQMQKLGRDWDIALLATNQVHYHHPRRRFLQDILTCVRHGCTIAEGGFRLFSNGQRCIRSAAEMEHLFYDLPGALRRTMEVAERCEFSLDELRYEYPDEIVPEGKTSGSYLAELTWEGAKGRYPEEKYGGGIPPKVREQIGHELALIGQLKIEPYFLTVYDLVRFARQRGILCQGRGSAANSAVCYCLGVTSVDPDRIDVLFERFVSAARGEPPDIDIDFEHERREEVIQYVYEKYGRERAGMTAEVITYRGRSAVRDVGKVLGLGLDAVDRIAKSLHWWDSGRLTARQLAEAGLDGGDRTVRILVDLVAELLGFPRHLGQHVGGMVMTRGKLCELVPIENASMEDRTVIEWDKDDIDALGILKVDVLGLGMLTCIGKAMKMISKSGQVGVRPPPLPSPGVPGEGVRGESGEKGLELHLIPAEDGAVYEMISDADTIGVFQIESRAQMSMLPRLRPKEFYDLVIEVAIVRPGPIQGDMVHPYLRRRCGLETVEYPSEALRNVLQKTLGVPLFQEQAMKVAMVAAGFSAEEADQLRRAMAAWRYTGSIHKFHKKIIEGMLANGYTAEFAERCFNQIKGFAEYGFPESHAASFALLVYASAWIKRHHPGVFCCALLNSQPMGFYQPAQIVRDAREHGVEVRGMDVNFSEWDCTLEEGTFSMGSSPHPNSRQVGTSLRSASNPRECQGRGKEEEYRGRGKEGKSEWGLGGPAVRWGLRQIRGFREVHAGKIVGERRRGGEFLSVEEFHERTGLPRVAVRRLAEGDAFGSLPRRRRRALWETMGLSDEEMPLFSQRADEKAVALPEMPLKQEVLIDYSISGLSLKRHPMSFVREALKEKGVITAAELNQRWEGWVKVAGLVLIRQRPGTASGIVFMTLEDETGVVNLIVKPDVFDRYSAAARGGVVVRAEGRVQREGQVIHVMAQRIFDVGYLLNEQKFRSRDFQ